MFIELSEVNETQSEHKQKAIARKLSKSSIILSQRPSYVNMFEGDFELPNRII